MLIDTHAHLFWESYKDDLDKVLQNAADAGVETIINVGVSVELSKKSLDQIQTIEQFGKLAAFSTIAIHPEDAKDYWKDESKIEQDIAELEKIYLSNPQKVIAVGECGLDYGYFNRDGFLPTGLTIERAKDLQRKLFLSHIKLAKKYNLPLILHVRDDRSKDPGLIECWDEVFEMAGDHFGILHCYSGLAPTTQKAVNSNFLVSFAGNLTYPKNEYLTQAVKTLPLEKIVLETDCPFLPPQSIRGQRNEPSSVKEIAQLISELKTLSFEEVAQQTTSNVKKLFKI